jgi:DNA topoisomerase III
VTTRITRVEGEAVQDRRQGAGQSGLARRVWQGRPGGRQGSAIWSRSTRRDGEAPTKCWSRPTATKPPARFNEATLLSAMEGAGKMVDDEELRAAMAGRGLGTPATRAQIIENLIAEQYMHREGRELIPSAKAFSLMTLLKGSGHQGTDLAGTDRRMGIQAGQHREGRPFAPRVHARDRRDDARHGRARQDATTSDTVPGDFGTLDALPEMRRGGQGELQEIPVPATATGLAVEDRRRPPVRDRPRSRSCCAKAASAR